MEHTIFLSGVRESGEFCRSDYVATLDRAGVRAALALSIGGAVALGEKLSDLPAWCIVPARMFPAFPPSEKSVAALRQYLGNCAFAASPMCEDDQLKTSRAFASYRDLFGEKAAFPADLDTGIGDIPWDDVNSLFVVRGLRYQVAARAQAMGVRLHRRVAPSRLPEFFPGTSDVVVHVAGLSPDELGRSVREGVCRSSTEMLVPA